VQDSSKTFQVMENQKIKIPGLCRIFEEAWEPCILQITCKVRTRHHNFQSSWLTVLRTAVKTSRSKWPQYERHVATTALQLCYQLPMYQPIRVLCWNIVGCRNGYYKRSYTTPKQAMGINIFGYTKPNFAPNFAQLVDASQVWNDYPAVRWDPRKELSRHKCFNCDRNAINASATKVRILQTSLKIYPRTHSTFQACHHPLFGWTTATAYCL